MEPTLGLLHSPGRLALATDLYQLTMAAAYWENGLCEERATFELFVRRFPPGRGYHLAAGLEQAMEYLRRLRFDPDAIDYLRALPVFAAVSTGFWDYLAALRFRGDVDALPEGTPFFPGEPVLQVRAGLVEAQLVETFLLAAINHQTLIATKAARLTDAAAGRPVVDFGARRAPGMDAALYGARAAVIGGCAGTSNVLAGRAFGLEVFGTAAHSFIMAFADEREAFRAFRRVFPEHASLLVDTYDTLEGVRRVAELGVPVPAIRIDSGDLAALSRGARRILDDAGLTETRIMLTGDLNEEKIAALLREGVPVDSFGVGTELQTSRDAPALGGVYKLVAVEAAGGARRTVCKRSPGKQTLPGVKQLYRRRGPDGLFRGDTLALREEPAPEGEPLLRPILRGGEPVRPLPELPAIRAYAREQRAALPEGVRRFDHPDPYPVQLSPGLQGLLEA